MEIQLDSQWKETQRNVFLFSTARKLADVGKCVRAPPPTSLLNMYGEGPPNEITCYHRGQDGTSENLKTNFLHLIACELSVLKVRQAGGQRDDGKVGSRRPLHSQFYQPSAAAGVSAHSVSCQEKKKKSGRWRICITAAAAVGAAPRQTRHFFSSQVICDKRNTTTKGSACTTACTWDQFRREALIHVTL